ncbi:MAG TPA: RICIN domain-containing protein [Polyangiaceae bacterium]|nr:RICIN domain-containing protein [Polyangiaceae bacterium]
MASSVLVLALGCNSTRVDAILALGEKPIQDCTETRGTLKAGTYRVRSVDRSRCWRIGQETSIFGNLGYLIAETPECTLEGELWSFENSDSVPGAFEVHSTSHSGFSLDVQESSKADGTNVITYGSHTLQNQRFYVREIEPGVYEFSPAHVMTSCISERNSTSIGESAIQIEGCVPTASAQHWQILSDGCGGASGS